MKARSSYDKMNIVVAGGAGFIGSHLCDELVKTAKVICIDNFLTGTEENINHLLANPDFKFIRHDVNLPIDFEAFPELKPFRIPFQGIQEVYDLACPTSPAQYRRMPVETLLASGVGTKNTLDIALKHKAQYLYLSSSAVYGEPVDASPVQENSWGAIDPTAPRSAFSEGKRYAESLIVQYTRAFHLDAKILRIFNAYGPRLKLDDGRMIPEFVAAALSNKDLVIYGSQQAVTSLLYISDLIEAMLKMMSSSDRGPFNIGNPESITMEAVAKLVLELTEGRSNIVYREPTEYMAEQTIPDITLAKERLGWFPVVTLTEGLRRTIEHLKGSRILRIEDIEK